MQLEDHRFAEVSTLAQDVGMVLGRCRSLTQEFDFTGLCAVKKRALDLITAKNSSKGCAASRHSLSDLINDMKSSLDSFLDGCLGEFFYNVPGINILVVRPEQLSGNHDQTLRDTLGMFEVGTFARPSIICDGQVLWPIASNNYENSPIPSDVFMDICAGEGQYVPTATVDRVMKQEGVLVGILGGAGVSEQDSQSGTNGNAPIGLGGTGKIILKLEYYITRNRAYHKTNPSQSSDYSYPQSWSEYDSSHPLNTDGFMSLLQSKFRLFLVTDMLESLLHYNISEINANKHLPLVLTCLRQEGAYACKKVVIIDFLVSPSGGNERANTSTSGYKLLSEGAVYAVVERELTERMGCRKEGKSNTNYCV